LLLFGWELCGWPNMLSKMEITKELHLLMTLKVINVE
jgi:hypothetical protein